MNLTDRERNLVRCSVALSVPLVINYLAHGDSTRIQDIVHMLPTYHLKGCESDILPYFTPCDLSDTGKRRVYTNANGFRIRYVTRKMLNRFRSSVMTMYPTPNFSIDAIIESFANRWIIMQGDLTDCENSWMKFLNRTKLIEKESSRKNHPPIGSGYFIRMKSTKTGSLDLAYDQLNDRIILDRYELVQMDGENTCT